MKAGQSLGALHPSAREETFSIPKAASIIPTSGPNKYIYIYTHTCIYIYIHTFVCLLRPFWAS